VASRSDAGDKPLKIKSKLYLSSLAVLALVVSLFAALFYSANKIAVRQRQHQIFEMVDVRLSDLNAVMNEYVLYHDVRREQEWASKYQTMARELQHLANMTPASGALRETILKDYYSMGDLFSLVAQNYREGERLQDQRAPYLQLTQIRATEKRLVTLLLIRSEKVRTNFAQLNDLIHADLADAQAVGLKVVSTFTLLLSILALFILSFFLALTRYLAKGVQQLAEGARILGTGNLDYRLPMESKDELGRLAGSLNQMAAELNRTTVSRDALAVEIGERGHIEEALRQQTATVGLLQVIASTANTATHSEAVFRECLEKICHYTGWPVGHVYLPSVFPRREMLSTRIWYLADLEKFNRFREVREATSQEFGYGLAGQVWERSAPVWIRDVSEISDCPRSIYAKEVGVRAGFAFPVMVGTEVAAVLEFFSSEAQEPNETMLTIMKHIGTQLGRVIERERSARALQESETRFRRLSNAASEGILVHENGVIVEANKAVSNILGYSNAEILGSHVVDYVLPVYRETALRTLTFSSDSPYEFVIRRKEGESVLVEAQGKNIPYQGHEARVMVFRDVTQRQKAEGALRESERRFRVLFDDNPQPMWVWDEVSLSFLEVNECAVKRYGYTKDEFLTKKLSDIQMGNISPGPLAPESIQSYETKHRLKGGQVVDVTILSHLLDFSGRSGILMVAHDITERKQAEQALKESEDRFRRLSDSAFEAIIIHRDMIIVEVNRAFLTMFGYESPQEVVGTSASDLIRPQYRESVRHKVRLGDETHYEMAMIRKDGSTLMVEVRARAIPYAGGIARVATLQDITERKRTEIILKEREERLRFLVEQMPAILWSTNGDLKFLSSVGAGLRTLDLLPNQLNGKSLAEYFKREGSPHSVIDGHQRALQGESLTFQMDWKGRTFEAHVEPLRNQTGEISGTIAVALDITDRKSSEEKLRRTAAELIRSNKELEQFAYVASHDLQEPLRMIASYMELLARRYRSVLDVEADEFITYAVDGAKRMKQQIDDLLAYSRVDRRGSRFESVDCGAVMERVLSNLRLAIQESGASIDVTPLPVVSGDDLQLGQVFQNLISNAIKFRSKLPPRIKISADRRSEGWLFSVRDNGIGIEMEYADRIFLIFQRLHTLSEYPGTGIGLAICKKIIERHGGRIWVESKKEGGSVFHFTLPMSVPEMVSAGATA
jgi:PAS domain S-box-containing protein